MGQIFSMDSKVIKVLTRIVDLVILNIIFLLSCIPIVTIGASVTALYSVTLKMVKQEESYIVRSYFKAFKENWKKATIIWLGLLAFGIILWFNNQISLQFSGMFHLILRTIFLLFQIVAMIIFAFVFPIMSKFENPVKNHLINSICMPCASLYLMLIIMLITYLPAVLMLCIPRVFLFGIYLMIMIWFALSAYINSIFFNKMFKQYISEEENES